MQKPIFLANILSSFVASIRSGYLTLDPAQAMAPYLPKRFLIGPGGKRPFHRQLPSHPSNEQISLIPLIQQPTVEIF